jgi:hypothetical protein
LAHLPQGAGSGETTPLNEWIRGRDAVAAPLLLIWADRRAQERKGPLLITVFPVITGLTVAGGVARQAGLKAAASLIGGPIMGNAFIAVMTFSYLHSQES